MDYWGSGTMVVVTSASPAAPTLFPLIPSEDTSNSETVNIGCLAKDYLPQTITFVWNDRTNTSIGAANSMTFPPIFNPTGTYTTSTQASVPATDWNNMHPFYCNAEHSSGNKVKKVVRSTILIPIEPQMIVRAPPLKAFSSQYLNSTISCTAVHPCKQKTTLQWLREEVVVDSDFTTTKPIPDGNNNECRTISELVVLKSEWMADKRFSCHVQSESFNNTLEINKQSFCDCPDHTDDVRVETIRPSYAEMFQSSKAQLTCKVYGIPYSADISLLDITWTQGPEKKPLVTKMQPGIDNENDMQYVTATAEVCVTDWNSGEIFYCKADFPGVFPKPIERELRKHIGGTPSAPSVYLLPPPPEQVALKEKVTLTCFVKGFYPDDIFVQWMQNGQLLKPEEYYTSDPILESKMPEKYFIYSKLDISQNNWSNGDIWTCAVGHEALPVNVTQKTIDKNTGEIATPSVFRSQTRTCQKDSVFFHSFIVIIIKDLTFPSFFVKDILEGVMCSLALCFGHPVPFELN
uniref:Ig-like domain-containing protein n=1 Tax=Varanus komodoensis TaxID=61221 RepID=A0A8D2L3D0_VARKO